MLLHGVEDPSFVRRDNTLARPYISYTQSDRVDIVLTNPPFGGREEDGIESNFPQHFRTRETADLFLALIVRLLKSNGRAAVVLPDGTLFGEGVKPASRSTSLRNPHTVADDHGDPAEWLARLNEAEAETVALRDQLKAILAEALLR
jgi:type I restriction enzyme M protein